MKTPRPLSTASRRSLAKLRQSYERGLLATTIAAVSRSYPTLALGILLLGYLSTELLPHSALSFGLALCGGGAFLLGAISLRPHRSEAHDAEARGQARSTLALRIGLGLLLLLGARLYYARSMQEVIEAPPPLHQPLRTEVITVERVTQDSLLLSVRPLSEGSTHHPLLLLRLVPRDGRAERKQTNTTYPAPPIQVGDTLTLSLERLHTTARFLSEQPSYGRYLLSEGIATIGQAHLLSHHPTTTSTLLWHAPTSYALRLRTQLTTRLSETSLSPYAQHLLRTMTLGEKMHDALGKELRTSFTRGGVAHLLAVSGFHLAVVIGALSLLCSFLPPLRRHARGRYLLLLGAAWGFTLVTGASIPTLRAAGMLSMYLGFRLLRRPVCALEVFSVPALIQLLFSPLSLTSASFLMTYLALVSIRLFYRPIEGLFGTLRTPLLRYLWSGIAMTLSVQPLLFPLSLYLFGSSSLAFLWSALLVVPLASLLIPVSLLTFLFLPFVGAVPSWLLLPLEWGAKLMRQGVELIEGVPALMLHYPLSLEGLLLTYLLLALGVVSYYLYHDKPAPTPI